MAMTKKPQLSRRDRRCRFTSCQRHAPFKIGRARLCREHYLDGLAFRDAYERWEKLGEQLELPGFGSQIGGAR